MMRIVTACVMAAGLAAPVIAQSTATTNMEILRQKIKADKKLVVAQNLTLTDVEGTAFWPVYDAYQKDLQQINQRLAAAILAYAGRPASAQLMTKPQVANLIKNVENGVDEFRNYLEKRGDNANNAASTAQAQGRASRRKATDSQKANASGKKDALDDALGDLNRSTNRLRRKFDPTDKWMDTKGRVEKVLDDARKINQVIARGSYGAEAARLWAVLRTGINDLARAYGVPPLGI
jgi:hypothetical protein